MQKYNFYELKNNNRIGKNLPTDVNEPVHKMLIESLNAKIISDELREMERFGRCGKIQVFIKDSPKYLVLNVKDGMVPIHELVKDGGNEKISYSVVTTIKNKNLSMEKPKWLKDKKRS